MPAPAVRIGGKKAPRMAIIKKKVELSEDVKLKHALSSRGYTTKVIPDVESCCFIAEDKTVLNYRSPVISGVFLRDEQPVGYIVMGEGEILGGGQPDRPTFDLETIAAALSKQGVDIKDLVKKVEEGDQGSMEKIFEILRQTNFSGDEKGDDEGDDQGEDKGDEEGDDQGEDKGEDKDDEEQNK